MILKENEALVMCRSDLCEDVTSLRNQEPATDLCTAVNPCEHSEDITSTVS